MVFPELFSENYYPGKIVHMCISWIYVALMLRLTSVGKMPFCVHITNVSRIVNLPLWYAFTPSG